MPRSLWFPTLLPGVVLACLPGLSIAQRVRSAVPTYAQEIAPVLARYCVSCHRPGAVGPFSLTDYASAKRHASQIAQVTANRYMPPWKPEPDSIGLQGQCRLSTAQVSLLRRWAKAGAPAGSPVKKSSFPPDDTTAWKLGKPDVIIEMPKPYTLPEATAATQRWFPLPLPVEDGTTLRAIEFQPVNTRVVRYASLMMDSNSVSLQLEEQAGGTGFAETIGRETLQAWEFVGEWSPGASPNMLPEGTGYTLKAERRPVLLLHLHPTGKPETVQVRLGLYFTRKSSLPSPVQVTLGSPELYLAPEGKAVLRDTFTLPTAARLIGMTPALHTIGRRVLVRAVLPNRQTLTLLQINDWDANWKWPYQPLKPLTLPAGTRLIFEATFDNTDENPRNPSKPPHRIIPDLGFLADMALLRMALLPVKPEEEAKLRAASVRTGHRPKFTVIGGKDN